MARSGFDFRDKFRLGRFGKSTVREKKNSNSGKYKVERYFVAESVYSH